MLVRPCQKKVEERNDGSLEFRSAASIYSGGRESLPDDRLANVSGDEQGYATAQSISLLEKLVQENDNETSDY